MHKFKQKFLDIVFSQYNYHNNNIAQTSWCILTHGMITVAYADVIASQSFVSPFSPPDIILTDLNGLENFSTNVNVDYNDTVNKKKR